MLCVSFLVCCVRAMNRCRCVERACYSDGRPLGRTPTHASTRQLFHSILPLPLPVCRVAKQVDDELVAEELAQQEKTAFEKARQQEKEDARIAGGLIADEVRGMVQEKREKDRMALLDQEAARRLAR